MLDATFEIFGSPVPTPLLDLATKVDQEIRKAYQQGRYDAGREGHQEETPKRQDWTPSHRGTPRFD